jgi:hypothetical protein
MRDVAAVQGFHSFERNIRNELPKPRRFENQAQPFDPSRAFFLVV